jgi:hypothetical protein
MELFMEPVGCVNSVTADLQAKSCFTADRPTKPMSPPVSSHRPLDQVPSTIPADTSAIKAPNGPTAPRPSGSFLARPTSRAQRSG